ncbi:MAG TPA: hypothetical protein VNA69_18280 [Thermoanaerobaculia bacterium]|nr:hypothetical protein [Thermoanaerobaculia bacterium]
MTTDPQPPIDSPARRYLRYLALCAHEAGLPYLPIEDLRPSQVSAWIDYLRDVIGAHERVEELLHECRGDASPDLRSPPRAPLPATYVPPYEDLAPAADHEHLIVSPISLKSPHPITQIQLTS